MKVLIICEHGSAKSVIAAAHFDRLARERGAGANAASRGTHADATYPSHVLAGLAGEGLRPLDDSPQELAAEDFKGATHVITFCDISIPAQSNAKFYSWEDVPAVSDGYAPARDEIVRRIEAMLSGSEKID